MDLDAVPISRGKQLPVGQSLQVTRERIRQIEAKALRKLRHPSRSRKLKAFLEGSRILTAVRLALRRAAPRHPLGAVGRS